MLEWVATILIGSLALYVLLICFILVSFLILMWWVWRSDK